MKSRIAAVLLLCSTLMALPLQAEPLKRSPRPAANPVLAKLASVKPVAQPISSQADLVAIIGPVFPTGAKDAPLVAAPPLNPRLGAITLSTSDRAPLVAEPGLPMIGEMLPAAMPQPAPKLPTVVAAPAPVPVGPTVVASLSAGPDLPAQPAIRPAEPKPAPVQQEPGLRPKARPASVEEMAKAKLAASSAAAPAALAEATPSAAAPVNGAILLTSLKPKKKPAGLVQLASASLPAAIPAPAPEPETGKGKGKKSKEPVSAKGSVCGVAAIKGEKIAPIGSKVQGCGLSDGVRVTSVSGVRLSMSATIDCATAKALNTWVERVAQPAYGNKITELQIAGHYVCRPRNNKKGAKVSEHGRGKAIDISGFRLASGKVIRVLGGFDATMRKAHKGACGIFGTTLGPGSDGYHEDHLHFDTAAHRNGSYCR